MLLAKVTGNVCAPFLVRVCCAPLGPSPPLAVWLASRHPGDMRVFGRVPGREADTDSGRSGRKSRSAQDRLLSNVILRKRAASKT